VGFFLRFTLWEKGAGWVSHTAKQTPSYSSELISALADFIDPTIAIPTKTKLQE